MNQIYRGKVWIICSEQFDPKFLNRYLDEWTNDIQSARFYGCESSARATLNAMKKDPENWCLEKKELEYTNVIELNLVQDWPD